MLFQGQTMQMMYELVARELKSAQLEDSHPCDYLNFYCLGNREEQHEEEESNLSTQSPYNDNGVMVLHFIIYGIIDYCLTSRMNFSC